MSAARIGQLGKGIRSAALGSTSALTAAQALLLGSSLIVNIFSARVLGPTGRGQLALHLQISYLLSSALVLGRDQALLVQGKFPSAKAGHAGVRRLMVVPGVLCLLLGTLLGALFSSSGTTLLGYIVAYIAMLSGSLCFRMGRAVAIVTARPWSFSLVVGISQCFLSLAAVALFVNGERDPIPWLLAYGLASSLPIACWTLMVGHGSVGSDRRIGVEQRVKRLGYRMILGSVAEMVLLRVDRLLLPVFGSFAGLGIYVVASTFSELSTTLVRQYVDARTPTWKTRFDGGSLRFVPLLGVVFALSAGVSAVIAVMSYLLIPILFGSDYLPALPLVPILAGAAALYGASRLGVALAAILDVPRWASIINGLGAAIGVGAYVLLIPMYGPLGAAVGSLIAYGCCAVATLVLCIRQGRIHSSR